MIPKSLSPDLIGGWVSAFGKDHVPGIGGCASPCSLRHVGRRRTRAERGMRRKLIDVTAGARTRPAKSLRLLLGLALAAGLSVTECGAQSPKYPDKPVRMLVGFSAGGGTDVVARILAQKMTETLGQTVVVENRPGASGMIAGEAVAKAAPDGYTLMMGSQTTFAVAPTLYRKTSLDPARDFAGIAMS